MKAVITLGLTGGFGTGKSTALAAFKRAGASVFSCDEAARILMARSGKKGLARSLENIFGPDIIRDDGSIVRDEIARRAFQENRLRRRLEAMMHPLIRREIEAGLRAAPVLVRVVETPLLFEAHWESLFDTVLTVRLSARSSTARLLKAGWSLAELRRRQAAQMPLEIKCCKSDFILDNEGPRRSLLHQVRIINQACMVIAGLND